MRDKLFPEIPLEDFLAVCDDCDIADMTVTTWAIHGKKCAEDDTRPVKIAHCYCNPEVTINVECKCGRHYVVWPEGGPY